MGSCRRSTWQDGAEGVAQLPDPAAEDLTVTATPYGMIEHPLPIVQYSQTPGFWALPPEPAGASDAVWGEPAPSC